MTTPTISKGSAVSAQTKAGAEIGSPAAESAVKPINRREFLYYIWGASMVVLLAETTGATIWFLLPRFREGEFGGLFPIDPTSLPPVGSDPVLNPAGRFWVSNTQDGLLALSAVCTHLGCLYKWVPTNTRFECPCHGSKFQGNGVYIEGPAPRNLDRFAISVITPGGAVSTDPAGDPVSVAGATRIEVNTGKKIKGQLHA